MTALLRAEGLTKGYSRGLLETTVLRGVSLTIARGETASLVGESGSGKSTLLALLAGLMRPGSGRVIFDEQDLAELDDAGRATLRARRIGVALQKGNLIPFLTAAENVQLALDLGGRGHRSDRAAELLERLGVGHRADHRPSRLSGGEAQRVALAVALANAPDLLLADEIVGELDSGTAEQVIGVVFEESERQGLAVLLVTHSRELAATTQTELALVDGEVRRL
jgi:putative ABC transport system ATP-binding protein